MGFLENMQDMLPWFGGRDRKQNAVPLRTFGKLPVCTDFDLTIGAEGAGAWYVEWIENGRKQFEEAMGPIPCRHRVLLSPEDHPDAVVGIIVNSRDRAGRCYPFTVYVLIPKSRLAAVQPALTHWLCAVWETLDLAFEGLNNVADTETFHGFCENRALTLAEVPSNEERESLITEWLQVPTERWLECVLGEWFALKTGPYLQKVGKCLSAARSRPIGLRMVLGQGLHPASQVDFWIDAISRIRNQSKEIPTLLYATESAKALPVFNLITRPTEIADYLLFAQGDRPAPFVEDFSFGTIDVSATEGFSLEEWISIHPNLQSIRDELVSLGGVAQ